MLEGRILYMPYPRYSPKESLRKNNIIEIRHTCIGLWHRTCYSQVADSNGCCSPPRRGSWAIRLRLCASVAKEYNLVPAKGQRCSSAGKVSAGQGGRYLQPKAGFMTRPKSSAAVCQDTGISSVPNAR